MSFRHDRRRRVLADDSSAAAPALDKIAPLDDGGRRVYNQRARRDQQPRLTELVPTRYRTLALWLAVGLVIVSLVVAIDTWLPELVRWLHAEGGPALELSGHRPLAVWMSSLLLGSGGLMAALLYSLRRHRVDDYHGRYRVWLWAAAAWFCLSLDETTSLHRLGQILCASWSTRFGLSPAVVWNSLCGVLLAGIGIRLVIEMRHSRLAVTALMLGAACWLLAVSADVGWISSSARSIVFIAAGRLVGQFLLLFSLAIYARHIILDVEGLLPQRAPKPKQKRERKNPPADTAVSKPAVEKAQVVVDPPQAPKPHVAPRSDLTPSPRPAPLAAATPGPLAAKVNATMADTAHRGLTRAERKKLRREQRQQRGGAATDEDDD